MSEQPMPDGKLSAKTAKWQKNITQPSGYLTLTA
jgi:hypothetical protein